METGYLNQIHDEEHFSSTFYNQSNGLEDSDHMLFGEMIVPEIVDYENPWQLVEDAEGLRGSGTRKEDFQKMVSEWRHQLNYMQETEVIQQILPVKKKTNQEISDMFVIKPSAVPTDPCIDELFPLDTTKESIPGIGEEHHDNDGEENPWEIHEAVAAINIKLENENVDDYENIDNYENVDDYTTPETSVIEESVPDNVKSVAKLQAVETIPDKEHNSDQINVEKEKEDLIIDVETGGEELPLLLAQDLTSLLEQFEATEKVNSMPVVTPASPSPPRPSNQTIRDALPAEVINRIKASRESHKKIVSVIPAMPVKRPGKAATRMQDAGVTLSRNKLLKLVTGGAGGETVSLDHDYCNNGGDTNSNSSRGFYVSDSSEYPSQSSTPDYFIPQQQRAKQRARVVESSSRKDSGLESGENSDEEVPLVTNEVVIKSVTGLKKVNVVTEKGLVLSSNSKRKVPMVSVLKKNAKKVEKEDVSVNSSAMDDSDCLSPATPTNKEDGVENSRKKKKLNLEEYRVRRVERDRVRSQESSRANSPTPSETLSVHPDSTTLAVTEGGSKEKPVMLSVEVQTQTCDFTDFTSSKSQKEQERSRVDHKEKRNDLKHRSYRSRRASSSSSSSSSDSDRHRSHKRKRSSKRSKNRKTSVSRMWSRSPSKSPSRSHSGGSSRSRSRDRRQSWRGRSPHRSNNRFNNNNFRRYHRRDSPIRDTWHRSRSPIRAIRNQEFGGQEKHRQVEERRVIYVGRIDEGTTKADLRKRFQQFGAIVDISVHFRERGDNYGFVTFAYKVDAYQAVEHGNDDPKLPRYDLCFGGRRAFCKQRYADLDGIASVHSQYGMPMPQPPPVPSGSFDHLLHEMKSQLRKRSSV